MDRPIDHADQPGGHQGLFRLPAIAQVDVHQMQVSQPELSLSFPGGGIGSEETAGSEVSAGSSLSLHHLKPVLAIGIPYYSRPLVQWQPILQGTTSPLPLEVVRQSLTRLLATITPPHDTSASPQDADGSETQGSEIQCEAIGLSPSEFQSALSNLSGVIVSHPAMGFDAYGANLRAAVIQAGLVTTPDQVYTVNEAIAALASGLRGARGEIPTLPPGLSPRAQLYHEDWQGTTLVLSAGATTTELAIATLPDANQAGNFRDVAHRSFAYAGHAIDQDIIFQLLYPAWKQATAGAAAETPDGAYTFGSGGMARSGVFVDGWHWQPVPPTDPATPTSTDRENPWKALLADLITPPSPGAPAPAHRQLLSDRLHQSPFGRQVLQVARQLKLELQRNDRRTVTLAGRDLTIRRQDLGSRVLLPYIQRLNRELSLVLDHAGITLFDVRQVLCTGGTASLGAIARWLRQKLPNATIIQDTYAVTPHRTNCLTTCSRVAYGLAMAPLHPPLMHQSRYANSDYALLYGVIQIFNHASMKASTTVPTTVPMKVALTVDDILQQLIQAGLGQSNENNDDQDAVQTLRRRVLALLNGDLPPGLVPSDLNLALLTSDSQQNPDYQKLLAAPLFHKLDTQTYQPNPTQWPYVLRYLDSLAIAPPLPTTQALLHQG